MPPRVGKSYTSKPLQLDVETFKKEKDRSLWGSFKTGFNMINLELTKGAYENYALDQLYENYEDEPKYTSSEIKDAWGLDVEGEYTERQVYYMKRLLEEKNHMAEEFGDAFFSPKSPIHWAATFAGAAIGVSIDPFNLATTMAIGPVAGKALRAGSSLQKTRLLSTLADRVKNSRQIEKLKRLKISQRLASTESRLMRLSNDVVKSSRFRNIAKAGGANTIVEMAVHNDQARKGYHYDIGPAIALGIFAPAFLSGVGAGIGKLKSGRGPSSVASGDTLPKERFTSKSEIDDIKKKQTFTDEDIKKAEEYDVDAEAVNTKDVKDLTPSPGDKVSRAKGIDEKIKLLEKEQPANWKKEARQFKALRLADKVTKGKVTSYLVNLHKGLLESNFKIDLETLAPFLKSQAEFRRALEKVRKARHGDKFKEYNIDDTDVNNLFRSTLEEAESYKETYKIKEKEFKMETETLKAKTLDEEVTKKIESSLTKQDSTGSTSRVSKEILKAFDDFDACTRKGGTVE